MPYVVVTATAQIHPSDERDVLDLPPGVSKDDQLLVMTSSPPDPFVQEDLPSSLVHHLAEVKVLLFTELLLVGVRPPHEPSHVDAFSTELGQDRPYVGAGAVQQLLGVASPIGEQDDVPALEPA